MLTLAEGAELAPILNGVLKNSIYEDMATTFIAASPSVCKMMLVTIKAMEAAGYHVREKVGGLVEPGIFEVQFANDHETLLTRFSSLG